MKYPSYKIEEKCFVGDGAHASIKRVNDGILYLTAKNFKDTGLSLNTVDFISKNDFDKHFKINSQKISRPIQGDIVFSIIGTIGVPYIVQKKDVFGLSSSVAILRPHKATLYSKFLFYWVQSSSFQEYLISIKSGVAQGFLSLGMIKKSPVILPPLPIQRKIAAILSAYDELIENNNRRIAILEKMAEEIYREWFVRLRFPGHENTKIVKGVPEGWEYSRISRIVSKENVRTGKRPKGGACDSGIPSIGAENINGLFNHDYSKEKYIPVSFFNDLKNGHIKPNDIGFYKDGAEIGRVTYFPEGYPYKKCSVNEHVFLIHANNFAYQSYLYFYFATPSIREYVHLINKNAAQPGINRAELLSIPLMIPTANIAKLFNEKIGTIINAMANCFFQNKNLKSTRDLLLPRLISGKLDVENLDIAFPPGMEEEAK